MSPRVPSLQALRPIGSGTTGTVELCTLKEAFAGLPAGEEVAVKRLNADKARDEGARRAFAAEAELGRRVSHPSLVRVLHHGVDDGVPYLVMQYVPGRSLAEILASDGPLPEPLLRRVGTQLAEALAALHRRGLVHGDLKPENIRLDEEGRAVLLDLGFASGAQTGSSAGSLPYLSPERALGAGSSQAADVFALGVVLYELATGVHPFGFGELREGGRPRAPMPGLGSSSGELLRRSIEVEGADELLARISEARLIPPSHFAPQLSPFLDRLLEEVLARQGDRRPGAKRLAELLKRGEATRWWRRAISDAGASGRPSSPPTRAGFHLTPLVGRERELARLQGLLAATAEGSQVVWIAGPEGSGKWRLVNEFATRARRSVRAPLYLYARWSESSEARPAGALAILLHRWLQLPPGSPPGEREMELLRDVVHPRTARTLLAALAGADSGARGESVAAALSEWLGELSRRGNVVVFLDDLQRARSETLGALSILVDSLGDARLLLLLGAREDTQAADPTELDSLREHLAELPRASQAGFERIELGPLTEQDVLALVEELFHREAPRLRLARELHRRSRGNPGIVAEILRGLVASGDARPRSDAEAALVLEIDPEDLPTPQSLDRMIAERVRALDPAARLWLERLSTVGGRIAPDFLLAAFPPTSRAEVEEVLAWLVREGWLVTAGTRYRFARPALREAVYVTLSAGRRKRLHAAAARGLEREGATSEERFQRAFHLRSAEEHAALLASVRELLESLRGRASPQRLLTLARWGLEALETLPHDQVDRTTLQLAFLEVAADAADRLGQREEQRVFLDDLVDLDLDPDARPAESARLYLLHGRYAANTGQFGLARGMMRNAAHFAAQSGDATLSSEVERRLAVVQAHIGELDEARKRAESAHALAESEPQRGLADLALAMVDILEDRVEEALARVDHALEVLRPAESSRPGIVAHAHLLRARVLRSAGAPVRALRAARRAVRAAQRSGERRLEAEARARLGTLLVDIDQEDEAEVQLRDALLLADKIEDRRGAVIAGTILGILLWEADGPGAEASIRRASELAHEIGFYRAEAIGLAIRARIHLERRELAAADEASAEAQRLVERHGAELVDRVTVVGTRALVLHRMGETGASKALVRDLRSEMRATNERIQDATLRRQQRQYTTRLLESALSSKGPVYPRTVGDS